MPDYTCSMNDVSAIGECYSYGYGDFITTTRYWWGTFYDDPDYHNNLMYSMATGGTITIGWYNIDSNAGVRPVIVVNKSNL